MTLPSLPPKRQSWKSSDGERRERLNSMSKDRGNNKYIMRCFYSYFFTSLTVRLLNDCSLIVLLTSGGSNSRCLASRCLAWQHVPLHKHL